MINVVMARELLFKRAGGIITMVPTTKEEALKMLNGLVAMIKKKAGELLSKLTSMPV